VEVESEPDDIDAEDVLGVEVTAGFDDAISGREGSVDFGFGVVEGFR